MKVIIENKQIKVESAYNKEWITRAHELSGRWNKPFWCFDESVENLVRESLMKIYGEDGRPTEKVVVDVPITDRWERNQEINIAGFAVARRPGRDREVQMMNGAILVSGGFSTHGGSVANPRIYDVKEDTVIRVEIPKSKLQEVIDEYNAKVYIPAKINKDALLEEKEALLKRLAEIEALLA